MHVYKCYVLNNMFNPLQVTTVDITFINNILNLLFEAIIVLGSESDCEHNDCGFNPTQGIDFFHWQGKKRKISIHPLYHSTESLT